MNNRTKKERKLLDQVIGFIIVSAGTLFSSFGYAVTHTPT